MAIKKIIVYFFLVCISSASCAKQKHEFQSKGLILGVDLALCPCCGGYIIEIDNDGVPYRFNGLPEESNIDLTQDSIYVKLDWNVDRVCPPLTYINIEKIELE